MNIFSTLLQGDSAYWNDDPVTDSYGKRYDSGSYVLSYVIAGPLASPLTLTAVANGTGWTTTLTAAQSATLQPGTYWWQAVITASGVRVTAGSGEFTIETNLAQLSGAYNGSTMAEKALADAEQALATFQTSGGKIKKYTIGMRTTEYQTQADLMIVVNYWRMRVANEGAASQIAQGLGNPRKMFVRFNP
jgi:hypothetical protein